MRRSCSSSSQTRDPDVAIVDIRMPPDHTDEGLVAADTIRASFPATGVLVLSQYVDSAYAVRLIDGADGGRGYLLKDRVMHAGELVAALARVAAGEVVVDADLVGQLLARRRVAGPLDELTDREREVLALMAEGLTDRGIAERLWLTPRTVETHIRHILRKLDLPDGCVEQPARPRRPCRTCVRTEIRRPRGHRSTAPGPSAAELLEALFEKALLGLRVHELEGPFVRCLRLGGAAELT